MNTAFNFRIAEPYTSVSQKVRVLTEDWVLHQVYCPNCGQRVQEYQNNKPVADFYCTSCSEDYELKSKKNIIGTKIVDGAYKTMIERLKSVENPNFFFLTYDYTDLCVKDFAVIPKHFFVPEIIEKRKALSPQARRAGWVGCNILLQSIPESGKIFYVKDKKITEKNTVLAKWSKTLFLRNTKKADLKGWILDVMKCIDMLGKKEFTLDDIYNFQHILSKKHPGNKHIKDKIRQQLQFLRDKGYIDFVERGKYSLR